MSSARGSPPRSCTRVARRAADRYAGAVDPSLYLAFIAAAAALILTPGPDTAYVAGRTLASGRAAGIAAGLGVNTGMIGHSLAAAIGLGELFRVSIVAFTVVKFAGIAYLVYLAWRLWRDDSPDAFVTPAAAGPGRAFIEGMTSNLLNPKVVVFFLAFLPQFVAVDRGAVGAQIFALGVTLALLNVPWMIFVAWFAGRVGAFLAAAGFARAMRRATAFIFVAIAARLAFATRP